MLLFERGGDPAKAHLRRRRCHCKGRKQRPTRLRGPSGSFPTGSLRSRRPLHCHRLLLSSPGPFRLEWPSSLGEMEPLTTAQHSCLSHLKPRRAPALAAQQSARAARLPGEEGIPGLGLPPCNALLPPSLPARPSGETAGPTAHCVARELFCACVIVRGVLGGFFRLALSDLKALGFLLFL